MAPCGALRGGLQHQLAAADDSQEGLTLLQ